MKGAQKVQSQFCDSAHPGNWRYDNLNRMTSSRNNDTGRYSSYMHRADGLRVHKGNFMNPTFDFVGGTFYRYDGQMSIEEYSVGSNHLVNGITRNTLGARGIDMIQRVTATVNETSYPLYDAHGNMTAQLLKNGASFTVANEKSYDAWGGIRSGNSNPEYKGRYCANLGHTQDDESSFIYMRARYYEPSSGRFVSEDTAMYGRNWFGYCKNNPTNRADSNGKTDEDTAKLCSRAGAVWGVIQILVGASLSTTARTAAIMNAIFLVAWFNLGGSTLEEYDSNGNPKHGLDGRVITGALAIANIALISIRMCPSSPTRHIVGLCMQHAGFLMTFIALECMPEGY
jgi:RHS repeat-associated protein